MNAALVWSKAWEEGQLSDEVLADRIGELISTDVGARGFFVISLASDSPILDRLPEAVVIQLRLSGERIVDLVIRNLAMSTAMAIQHEREKNLTQKESSKKISYRCKELLLLLDPRIVKVKLETLLEATKGHGDYVEFLERWGYDKDQLIAISESINSIFYG